MDRAITACYRIPTDRLEYMYIYRLRMYVNTRVTMGAAIFAERISD